MIAPVVVILCSLIQESMKKTSVVKQRISSLGQVPSNFPVVVTKSMKGKHKLILEEKRIGQAGEFPQAKEWGEEGTKSQSSSVLPG